MDVQRLSPSKIFLLTSSAALLILHHCHRASAQSVEIQIYGDELAAGWGDYSYHLFPDPLSASSGLVFAGQQSLRVFIAHGGFLRFVAFTPLRLGEGSMLEMWINVETVSAVIGNSILLDDSSKINTLAISAAYTWSKIQIPLDDVSLEYILIYNSVISEVVMILDEIKVTAQLPVFSSPQAKPKRYELKDLPPLDSPEAADAEVEIVLVGDSITHGWLIPGGFRKFLQPSLLSEWPYNIRLVGSRRDNQGGDNFDPNHEGYPGFQVIDIEQNVEWLFPRWSKEFSPQIAILMIGTNDILNKYWTEGVQGFGVISGIPRALKRCITKIFHHRPKIHVILASIPHLFLDDMSGSSGVTEVLRDQVVNEVMPFFQSRNYSITFSDVNSVVSTGHLVDGVHPSDDGFINISEALSQAFADAVEYAKGIEKK